VTGAPLITGARLGAATTVTAKEARDAVVVPSETVMTMPEYVPTFALVGVPVKAPLAVLKLAHDGLPAMLNVSELPSGSDAVGWKEYDDPTVTLVAGVPEITGGRLAGGLTVIANAASETDVEPSDTEMTMPEYVPAFVVVGVPVSAPVAVLKFAHDGFPVMLNVSGLPSGSEAAGWNE
jgi:hypothetical protein